MLGSLKYFKPHAFKLILVKEGILLNLLYCISDSLSLLGNFRVVPVGGICRAHLFSR